MKLEPNVVFLITGKPLIISLNIHSTLLVPHQIITWSVSGNLS